jgi:hypothetical protein
LKDVVEEHGKFILEVVLMPKTLLILFLIMCWTLSPSLGQAEKSEQKLIPVKPSYHEAAYVPHAGEQASNPVQPTGPNPRDQLYVFWILGKVLSYPVDKVEAFIYSRFKRAPAGNAQPAAAPANPNPFASVNWREIPPAPPVHAEKGSKR